MKKIIGNSILEQAKYYILDKQRGKAKLKLYLKYFSLICLSPTSLPDCIEKYFVLSYGLLKIFYFSEFLNC